MAIFKTIKEKAGGLFKSFKNLFSGGSSQTGSAGTGAGVVRDIRNGLDYTYATHGASGSWEENPKNVNTSPGSSNTSYGSSGSSGSYTPQYGGVIQSAMNPQKPGSFLSGGGGSSSGGGQTYGPPAPVRLSGQSAKQYASSAGLNGLNLEGKTYEEADAEISQRKDMQRGQNTALTSAVFSPDAPGAVEKRVRDLSLSIDSTRNDPWKNAGSKQEDVDNLLKSTAKDLANNFDSTEAMINAYDTNDTVRQSLDAFAQYGGSDQMLVDALNEKIKAKAPVGMSTADYLASNTQVSEEKKQLEGMVSGEKIITDEIARTAKIPEQLKDRYFGEEGIWQQRINLEKENIKLIKEKMADEKASAREQAKYYMEKNNAELSLAKSTIEQNRVNAKNYITGMLAKLGALQTTSAAAEGIASLDQKYQQQAANAESKVRYANQDIQIRLNKAVNDIENKGADKIQSIKEDLAKDQETILKDIAKVTADAEKRIYDLTLKADDRARKNVEKYTNESRVLAEDYTTQFSALVSGGLDVGKAAAAINVKLPAADQKISTSARIKDPNAIAYFKSLPTEFKNQWIQFALTQPAGTYFTMADLQANYEPYVLEQQQRGATKKSTTTTEPTMTDDEFLSALNQ